MKPFDEARHLSSLFRQKNREEQLKFVERIRETAIAILEPIRPPGYDLKNLDHAIIFCLEPLHLPIPATIPFRDALSLLRACTSALESGNVDQRHIDWIVTSYAGLDERLTGGATDWANEKAEIKRIVTGLHSRLGDVEVGEADQGLAPQTIEAQRQPQQNTNEIDSQKEKKNFFHRDHDGYFWKVGYEGETKPIRDLDGIRYIVKLLERPGKPVSCRELYQSVSRKTPGNIMSEDAAIDEGLNIGSSKQAVSDYKARQDYWRQLQKLQDDIDNAENSPEGEMVKKESTEKQDEIMPYLKGRNFADPNDKKAQVNIRKSLDKAYDDISKSGMKEMEKHLRAHIKTDGTYSLTYTGSAAWETTS